VLSLRSSFAPGVEIDEAREVAAVR
jgi:hypothetical protein